MLLLAGKISGFLSDCSSGAVWGDHCSNSCSLMKIQGYKSSVLKYRCTRPGNIVERQKVHFGSSLLEWNSSLCLKTNHFIYKICSLVIRMLTALWKTAQNLAWHLFACYFSVTFTTLGRLILNYMILFTMSVVNHWKRSRGSVDAPTLEAFKARVHETWSKLVKWNVSKWGSQN